MSSAAVKSRCVNCGTSKKSGKRSCCARGGDWSENCGDAGDTKLEHTWIEGIQACKDFSLSVTSPLQDVIIRRVGIIDQLRNIRRSRNATRQQTDMYHRTIVSDTVSTDSKDRGGLAESVVCIMSLVYHYSIADVL